MNSIKLPTWLRVVLVAGLFILATGAGLFAYHWYNKPVTLTIAVGSLDGEAGKVMSAIAERLVSMNAPVRLKAIETGSALGAANAFSSGKADLAVVRGDVGDLSQAQAVIVVAKAVALLIAPPGSPISDVPGLKHRTVGVVGGEINQKVVDVLTKEYDLAKAGVVFKNIAPADSIGISTGFVLPFCGNRLRTSVRYFSVRGITIRMAPTSLVSMARRVSAGAIFLNVTLALVRSYSLVSTSTTF